MIKDKAITKICAKTKQPKFIYSSMNRRKANMAATEANRNNRLSVNVFSFLVTCVILFVAVRVSDGGFANSIDKITKNIDNALQDLMDDTPKYSNYTETETYLSGSSFHPRGMAGLYNLTIKLMDLIIPPDFLMKDLIVIENGNPQIGKTEIMDILKTYWGILFVLIALALMAVLIPLCGLCFCFCRCCGRCGARSQPCDKKRDLCKKIIQGTLLIILGTALLFCVVCAFASNQHMQDGIDSLSENVYNSKNDTNTFLESTKKQATHLLVTNYQEFSTVFTSTIDKSSEYVMEQLEIWSNATAMMDLYAFVDNIPKIQTSLETLKNDTNSLRASASQLNDAMRKVKKDLLTTLLKCELPECKDISSNISQLQTNIDFNKLPDVSPTISKMNSLDLPSLQQAAMEGKENLINIEREIKTNLDETLQNAVKKVDEAGVTIKNNLTNILQVITDVQDEIRKTADPVINDMHNYIRNYGQYRYYAGLAICCILLLITICIALGLICGICGKRPDGYSDNCCNKGAGSQFLICAVMIMFTVGIVMAIVAIAMFVLGVSADRVICYPVRNPQNSTIVDVLDEWISKSSIKWDFSTKEVFTNCYQNKSVYTVFNLKQVFDIDTIHDQFDISSFLDKMNAELDDIIQKDFTILTPTNEQKLEDLKTLEPSINFDQFQEELRQNFTNLSLTEISKKLEELVVAIEEKSNLEDVKTEVKLSILHINMYDEKLLSPMKDMANKVINISQQLDTDLRMNASNFSEAITNLLIEIKEAQTILRTNGTEMLQHVATEFGEMVKNQVNSYLYRVGNVTKYELGQCGPLNVAINSTVIATCDKIVLPWNGFWVSLVLSLILFIPTIIVSVKLASLYQKYKQYGQYVETEYLYDAYADRGDNIPLNSRGAKRGGKKKAKKSKHYEDRPQNMGGEVVAREYATGSHPPDTRYSDMAPKHWEEFPNGGPPQYQRAPTEYERPPPYYYPGTGDQ